MSSSLNQVKTGKTVGNAATKKIFLGFKPRKVELFNETNLCSGFKTDIMETNKAKKTIAAGTTTFVADMITIEPDGFTIGADALLNAAASIIHFVAIEGKNE